MARRRRRSRRILLGTGLRPDTCPAEGTVVKFQARTKLFGKPFGIGVGGPGRGPAKGAIGRVVPGYRGQTCLKNFQWNWSSQRPRYGTLVHTVFDGKSYSVMAYDLDRVR